MSDEARATKLSIPESSIENPNTGIEHQVYSAESRRFFGISLDFKPVLWYNTLPAYVSQQANTNRQQAKDMAENCTFSGPEGPAN
jgi:hypothetical protein